MKNIFQKIFSITDDNLRKTVCIFGLKIKYKNPNYFKKQSLKSVSELALIKTQLINNNISLNLCFDHNLGGGTELYFLNELAKSLKDKAIFRIQYIKNTENFQITIYEETRTTKISNLYFAQITDILSSTGFENIILNNIVSYPSVTEILSFISEYKSKNSCNVVVKGHDFYPICPRYDLLNYKNEFCNAECVDKDCLKCYNNIPIKPNDIKKIFSIKKWQKLWNDFLITTADTVEMFSESSKNVFVKVFPDIENKISLKPHKIKPFAKYNIAFLGNFDKHKGSEILKDLVKYLKNNSINDYHFYVFGENNQSYESELITFLGKYQRNQLPILLEQNKINAIAILSICSETFSYTTAEAIALGYPVVCFNLGGQADQVSQYSKGKILSSYEPEIIEKELNEFLIKVK